MTALRDSSAEERLLYSWRFFKLNLFKPFCLSAVCIFCSVVNKMGSFKSFSFVPFKSKIHWGLYDTKRLKRSSISKKHPSMPCAQMCYLVCFQGCAWTGSWEDSELLSWETVAFPAWLCKDGEQRRWAERRRRRDASASNVRAGGGAGRNLKG